MLTFLLGLLTGAALSGAPAYWRRLFRRPALAEMLPWEHLDADGTLYLSNFDRVALYELGVPDIASHTDAQLTHLCTTVATLLKDTSPHATLSWDYVAYPLPGHPPTHPTVTDSLIRDFDRLRQRRFVETDVHPTSAVILTFRFTPQTSQPDSEWQRARQHLEHQLVELRPHRMGRNDVLAYLNFTLSGIWTLPLCPLEEAPRFALSQPLLTGRRLKIGGSRYIRVVTVVGYPSTTHLGLLTSCLSQVRIAHRLTHHTKTLSTADAVTTLKARRAAYTRKLLSFRQTPAAQPTDRKGRVMDFLGDFATVESAAKLANHVSDAMSGEFHLVDHDLSLTLYHDDIETLEHSTHAVVATLRSHGFTAFTDPAAFDTYAGTLAGTRMAFRRTPMPVKTITSVLPLTAPYRGRVGSPNPLYGSGAPSLTYLTADDGTFFSFDLAYGDSGHHLVFGPPGSGKSTLMQFLSLQFLARYPGARVVLLDYGYSASLLATHLSAPVIELYRDNATLAPLRQDGPEGRSTALDWLASTAGLALARSITPQERALLAQALDLTLSVADPSARTMVDFWTNLAARSAELAPIFEVFCPGNLHGPIMDGSHPLESLPPGLTVIEQKPLYDLENPHAYLPILSLLLRTIARSFDGAPTLLLLDEAFTHVKAVGDWIETLCATARKKNVSLGLWTQIPDQLDAGVLRRMAQLCPTKLFLPNPDIPVGEDDGAYEPFRLTPEEKLLIQKARPKKELFYSSPYGKALLSLDLGQDELVYLAPPPGFATERALEHLRHLVAEHSAEYFTHWRELFL